MKKLLFAVFIAVLALGCRKGEDIGRSFSTVNQFVWSAMNRYYYWVEDVEALDEKKYKNSSELSAFLNGYNEPENLFYDLRYNPGVVDRFSWIVDDYDELEASFQGISESYGYDFGLIIMPDGYKVFGYVRYVVPGSPADEAGLTRGDLFTEVDNIQITVDNYSSLLFEENTYTLTLGAMEGNTVIAVDQKISMTAVEVTENPILVSRVLEIEGNKVGYLMYNQFISNNGYHEQLNNVFGEFNSEGVTEVVLDLRYNGGGALLTSTILASMLYGQASSNDLLGTIIYNSNLSKYNSAINFESSIPIHDEEGEQTTTISMNRLDIDRIFILVGGRTASASEFLIVGLLPFLDVKLIGTKTVGKNVGSVTLYDSEDFGKYSQRNPDHKYALQPIISQLANSEGFTDYTSGLEPTIQVKELDYLEEGLKPLGDPDEVLLATALAIIVGNPARISQPADYGWRLIDDQGNNDHPRNTIILDGRNIPYTPKRWLDGLQ